MASFVTGKDIQLVDYVKRHRMIVLLLASVLVWYGVLHAIFVQTNTRLRIVNPSLAQGIIPLGTAPSYYDGGYYVDIAADGYLKPTSPRNIAFYPMYPLLLRFVHKLSFGVVSYGQAALILNAIFLLGTVFILTKIACRLQLKKPYIVALLLVSYPWAFFYGAVYAEALFSLLIAACMLLLMQKKYLSAALIAAVASGTRLPGVLLASMVAVQYLYDKGWRITINKKLSVRLITPKTLLTLLRAAVLASISCIGLFTWLGYQWYALGSPFAFQKAYEMGWAFQVFNLNFIGTILHAVSETVQQFLAGDKRFITNFFNVAAWLASATLLVVGVIKKSTIPVSWYVFGFLYLVLITLNSNVVSVNRYILPLLPVYFIVALLYESWRFKFKKIVALLVIAACFALQGISAVYYANQFWIG